MKFMKLGSKPDVFVSDGNSIRCVASDLVTDTVICVGDKKFYLHKFPLISKSNHLHKLVTVANEESTNEVHLVDFPGGPKAFEICAKFCYGMTVTLNAYNVVAARCAAEYLEMNDDIDRGNLISKIEVFLNSSIFRSWKDSIIALQTTKSLLPWSEDLKVLSRCLDSIALKASLDALNVNWSYTYNRKLAVENEIYETGVGFQEKTRAVPKDWWVEDICELEVDLYKKVMSAIKAKGRTPGTVIAEALKVYAIRWLPNSIAVLVSNDHALRNRALVETIVWLLPSDKVVSCSCGFLLKLLKVVVLVGAGEVARQELIGRISLRLDEAAVNDLLIPARSPDTTVYNIGLARNIVSRFAVANQIAQDINCYTKKNEIGTDGYALRLESWLKVGKLIDGYLAEISCDQNLSLASFIDLAQLVPESARPLHDGLYKAIDNYLKEHPKLTKTERKKLCGLMDVKKFSTEASMHAAQNDLLPVRLVVQILYFEQVRAATVSSPDTPQAISNVNSCSTTNPAEDLECSGLDDDKFQHREMRNMKVCDEECQAVHQKGSRSRKGGLFLRPSRSRRLIDKLWIVGKGHGDNKSSETSGSSLSACSWNPGEAKSSFSSSRNPAESIS